MHLCRNCEKKLEDEVLTGNILIYMYVNMVLCKQLKKFLYIASNHFYFNTSVEDIFQKKKGSRKSIESHNSQKGHL